ncbi:OTU-domain-containing protein [Suillus subaureus]|uniref:OTU-domain-containing protein n=1 Tax=Suillus subaureus TaxID=48587 RepID=A0A9P7EPY6_9AGAM|nr:OTU-domain-containing protein [Suillus subaureus]KAG1827357.1 OTU-domain-containing protein [Suillus subaureus]
MAGSRKNKIKKFVSPSHNSTPDQAQTEDNNALVDDLFAELDSRNQTVQQESATVLLEMQQNQENAVGDNARSVKKKQDSRSRHEARQQAKKAAALAQNYAPIDPEADARLGREAKEEEISIKETCDKLGVQMHEIPPDGHCLFSAVADQLAILHILPPNQANYVTVRAAASNFIYTHPDDFLPFLPSAFGEDGVGATSAGFMTPQQFEQYCMTIKDTGAWGGEPEILALSRVYNVPIHVVQGGVPRIVEHNPARISFHRRMYGLGEHYNSLRPKTTISQMAGKIQSAFS